MSKYLIKSQLYFKSNLSFPNTSRLHFDTEIHWLFEQFQCQDQKDFSFYQKLRLVLNDDF